jgi:hypothetical protein
MCDIDRNAYGKARAQCLMKSMEQSPSEAEADCHSASQEIPRLLWNRKFYKLMDVSLYESECFVSVKQERLTEAAEMRSLGAVAFCVTVRHIINQTPK